MRSNTNKESFVLLSIQKLFFGVAFFILITRRIVSKHHPAGLLAPNAAHLAFPSSINRTVTIFLIVEEMSRLPVTVARLRRICTGFPILPDSASRPPNIKQHDLSDCLTYNHQFSALSMLCHPLPVSYRFPFQPLSRNTFHYYYFLLSYVFLLPTTP
jgi:hypothetical protein